MRVRWDSPFVLAAAGTLAIHVILLTAGDALVVTHPARPLVPAPRHELVEVELPPVPPPAPEPPPPPPAPVEPKVEPPRPQVARPRAASQIRTPEAPPAKTDVPVPAAPSGGDQVVHMDDIAPSATGVAVAQGKPATRVGRGGAGGGTGTGSGAGSAEGNVKPVSIATIKTRAMPRRDYGYLALGHEYPAEAKALGIEGQIRVRLIVNERGVVTSRVQLNKLGHGLDELAMKQAAELEFDPAKDTEDRPVASVVVWTFTMTLPK